jgi:transposase InsO family protein
MKPFSTIGSEQRWARLRFAVVGPLLAAPRSKGELREALARLAETTWIDPQSGQPVRFAVSTIERWYYAAKAANDPVRQLARKRRRDRGGQPSMGAALAAALTAQHRAHPSWSFKLHRDNLLARAEEEPALGSVPSYPSVRRYMVAHGLTKRRRLPSGARAGELHALEHRQAREVRSYEAEYVNALWHLDFHHASRRILTASGEWTRPILLAILDDCSRLICHTQWYLDETAKSLAHGLIQAFLKRGLPRGLLSDNGGAMIAAETTQGLARLSILQQTTLPYSPHQNGKQEVFWAQVEGRLFAMLEGEANLTLELLNRATQAWVELEYHRTVHSTTGMAPLRRFLDGKSVARPCPSAEDLRIAFTQSITRRQRQSDGTISLDGRRYEIPARLRHVPALQIRHASWDKTHVFLLDEDTGAILDRIVPLDRIRNADGVRRPIHPAPPAVAPCHPDGIAPLLRRLMADYAATGLPPAYLPEEEP